MVLLVKEREKTGVKGHEQTGGLGKRRQRSRDVCSQHGYWGAAEPSAGFR